MAVSVVEKSNNKDVGKQIWLSGTLAEVSAELETNAGATAGYEYNQSCKNIMLSGDATACIFYYERY